MLTSTLCLAIVFASHDFTLVYFYVCHQQSEPRIFFCCVFVLSIILPVSEGLDNVCLFAANVEISANRFWMCSVKGQNVIYFFLPSKLAQNGVFSCDDVFVRSRSRWRLPRQLSDCFIQNLFPISGSSPSPSGSASPSLSSSVLRNFQMIFPSVDPSWRPLFVAFLHRVF